MQAMEKQGTPALPADQLDAIVDRHVQRDPAECIENYEGCAGPTNLRQCLEILEEIIVDLFDEHRLEEPHLPAPRVDDSILIQIAQTNACEDAVQFVRNNWLCASGADVLAALKEVREAHELRFNEQARIEGRPGVVVPVTSDAAANPAAPAAQPVQAPSEPSPSSEGKPQGWQPFATVPRDGTLVDLFGRDTARAAVRITNVRFIRAAEVNWKYAPGGEWENLAVDGWRRSALEDAALVDTGFTHWRLVETDCPPDA